MTPRESAEIEAKKTFELFILWSKRTLYFFTAFLFFNVNLPHIFHLLL